MGGFHKKHNTIISVIGKRISPHIKQRQGIVLFIVKIYPYQLGGYIL
jgi:hypothetical protein